MSYYEDRIKALEARIEEMALLNRMKAVSVEASLMIRIGELNDDNASLKAEVERLTQRGDEMSIACLFYANMIRTHLIHLEAPPFNFPYPMSLYASANRWNAAKEGNQP